jgi:D-alanine-D-alanine ligase
MRVAILHNAVRPDAPPEDQDTLVQVDAVAAAFARLGHHSIRVPCSLDLTAMCASLQSARPDVIFNLVESMADSDSLAYLPVAVLDTLNIPYTGSRTESLFLTTHKILAKQRMRQAGLPTSDWLEDRTTLPSFSLPFSSCSSWILKGLWDQGSRDMDDNAVLHNADLAEVQNRLRQRTKRTGRPCFCERFIDGREFVVAMLTGPDGPVALSPAEIEFTNYPPDKPRIVGYHAKWSDDRMEYLQTPRRFTFDPSDAPLLDHLRRLAVDCWNIFHLRGWARVDFRVDADNQPWILEVNANPCLSPDAGFAAALAFVGTSFDEAIQRILDDRQ